MRIHILAACGTGTASLAGLLAAAGHDVSGCDRNVYPPMSEVLPGWGVPLLEGHDPSHLDPPPDLTIIGNAVGATNPEAQAVLGRKLPHLSMAAAIGEFFARPLHSIVVSGTHGKTTTSALLSHLFTATGLDPTFLVGGIVRGDNRSWRLGAGKHFIVEGDEYETAFFDKGPKFLHYAPRWLILNNLEFDHADNFRDLAHLQDRFSELAALVEPGGIVFAGAGVPALEPVLRAVRPGVKVLSFGLADEAADIGIRFLSESAEGARYQLRVPGHPAISGMTPLAGSHNLRNLAVACAAALLAGAAPEAVAAAAASFHGVKRRQEIVGEREGCIVMDDFAHHPTAIFETLAALRRRWPTHRITALVEPRSYTCHTRHYQEAYTTAFGDADRVAFAPVPETSKVPPGERLDIPALLAAVSRTGKVVHGPAGADDLLEWASALAAPGELLVCMSSGSFSGLPGRLAARISSPERL